MSSSRRIRIATGAVLLLGLVLGWRVVRHRQAASDLDLLATSPGSGPTATAVGRTSPDPATVAAPPVRSRWVALEELKPGALPRYPDVRFTNRLRNTAATAGALVTNDRALLLRTAFVDTAGSDPLQVPAALRSTGAAGAYIVQARGGIDTAFRERLAAVGATIISYIPNNALLVNAGEAAAQALSEAPETSAILPYEPYFKLEPALIPTALSPGNTVADILRLVVTVNDPNAAATDFAALGVREVGSENGPFGRLVTVEAPAGRLAALARSTAVQLVERWHSPVAANDRSGPILGSTSTPRNTSPYLGLTGNGVLVNINDTGVDHTHPDLLGRIHTPVGLPTSFLEDADGHGTHVAAIIAGNGSQSASIKNPPQGSIAGANFLGRAGSAQLFALPIQLNGGPDLGDEYLQVTAATNTFRKNPTGEPLISNNSWVYDSFEYSSHSASFDAAVRDAAPGVTGDQPVLYVFAAGNAGDGGDNGIGGSADSINSPANAKNVITVGALESLRNITNSIVFETNGLALVVGSTVLVTLDTNRTDYTTNAPYTPMTDSDFQVAGFSGRGNVGVGTEGDSGRFKPDLVAPGTFIISARSAKWTREHDFPTNLYYNEYLLFKDLVAETQPFYRYETGTSMSAASIAGLLAQMQEFFQTRVTGRRPSAAGYKALLINSATVTSPSYVPDPHVQGEDPRNYAGWGEPYLPVALSSQLTVTNQPVYVLEADTFGQSVGIGTGEARSYRLLLKDASSNAPVRITLVWTDPPGNPAGASKLVNDLDLVVSNTVTHEVIYGNDFEASQSVSHIQATNDLSRFDRINNVERIVLNAAGGTNFIVSVVGHRVNVNARRDHPTGIVQDFALAIATDAILDSTNTTAGALSFVPFTQFPFFPGPRPNTNAIPNPPGSGRPPVTVVSNGIPLMAERVGANSPLVNAVLGGQVEQWQFYVFTNSPGVTTIGDQTLTNGSNVAFITFPVGELSRSRTNEPDIDLYVSRNPQLTNLNSTAVGSALKSLGRGGSEMVVITNSPLTNEIYYIGVKSEDQQGAEYGLVGVSSAAPFTTLGADGRARVLTIPLRQPIPDGRPDRPGVGLFLGISTLPGTIRGVSATVTATHQNFSDLLGNLSHAGLFAVLDNHSPLVGLTSGTNITVTYDDSQSGYTPGSVPSDGPGSLVNFLGEAGTGAWFLTTSDNALGNVGRISAFDLRLLPNDFGATFVPRCVSGGRVEIEVIDVPPDATGMTITITNMQPALPLEVFIKKDEFPDVTNPALADKHATILPPGGEVFFGVRDIPALQPGRYFIAVYNPQPIQICYRIRARLDRNFDALNTRTYSSKGFDTLIDQGRSYSVIPVDDHRGATVASVGIHLEHPRKSDLAIRLFNPSGAGTLLMENRGANDRRGLGSNVISTNLAFAHVAFSLDRVSGRAVLYVNGVSVAEQVFAGYLPPTTNVFYFGSDPSGQFAPSNTNQPLLLDDFALWRTALREDQVQNIFRYGLDGSGKREALVKGDLLSLWPFDTDGRDVIGTNDVILTSKSAFVPGQINQALRFVEGAGGQIPATSSMDVSRAPAFTLEGWVNLGSLGRTVIGGWGNTNKVWGPVLLANFPPPIGNGPGSITLALNQDASLALKSPGGVALPDASTTNAIYAIFSDTTNFTSQLIKFANPPLVTDSRIRVLEADDFETNAAGIYQPLFLKTIKVDGWTINRGAVEQVYNGDVAFNGQGYLALDQAEIQKSFKTTPGRTYTAVFTARRGLELDSGTIPVTVQIADVTSPAHSTLAAGDLWQTNILTFQAQSAETAIKIFNPTDALARVLIDAFRFVEDGAAQYIPEEPLAPLATASAVGNWMLEITDTRGTNSGRMIGWQLGLIFAPTNTPSVALTNGSVFVTNVAVGETRYFTVEVPPEAFAATNFLQSAVGTPVNLLFSQLGIPDGTQQGDFVLLNGVTSPGQSAMINPTTVPPLKPGQRYYLGVQNPGPAPSATFAVRVDFNLHVRKLTNGISALGTNQPGGLIDYYYYDVSDNGMSVRFALTNLTGDVNLVARKGPDFPTRSQYDYQSTNSGTNTEEIIIDGSSLPVGLSPGRWYLGVYSAAQPPLVPINYRISANETPFPTSLTNHVPLTAKLTNSGFLVYYFLNITNDPQSLTLTLTNLSGNANLYLKKGLPLPVANNFDYGSTNAGTANERIVINTNSTPIPLSQGQWFIAVEPVDPTPIQFTLLASLDFPLAITDLTDGVPLSTSHLPDQPKQTYRFVAPPGTGSLIFEIYNLTGEADLYGALGELPVGKTSDITSTLPGTTPDVIVLHATPDRPDLGGTYYLEVRFTGSTRTDYTIRAATGHNGSLESGQPIEPIVGLPTTAGGPFSLTFNSLPGETYWLEHTTNLFGNPVTWTLVGTTFVANGFVTQIDVPNLPVADSTLQAFRIVHSVNGSVPITITGLLDTVPMTTTTALAGGVDYYSFDVSTNATGLRFAVNGLTDDVSLVVHAAPQLPTPTSYSFVSTNSGLAPEEIIIDQGSSPVVLAPGRWYAGVFSPATPSKSATYTIVASEIPYPQPVTNSVTHVGTLTASGAVDYFYVDVPAGVSQATFSLTNSANADLYVRGAVALAGPHAFSAASTNSDTTPDVIVLTTGGSPVSLTSGRWFIGVASAAAGDVHYGLTVTFAEALDATFLPAATPGGPFSIVFTSIPGAVYRVEYTDDLFSSPVLWSLLGAPLTATATSTTVSVSPPAGAGPGLRSYRVVQISP